MAATEDYSFSDYAIFDNARQTAVTFNNETDDVKTKAGQVAEIVKDTARFKGPAADASTTYVTALIESLATSMDNYDILKKFLDDVSDSYHSGDTKASNNLLKVGLGSAGFKTDPRSSLVIPSDINQCGYTVTGYGDKGVVYTNYSSVHWNEGSNQRKVFEEWEKQGGKYKNGIAVLNVNGQDCYLVASSEEMGNVGDVINYKLENGENIPAVVADAKSSSDDNYSEYGHVYGNQTSVVELEVDMHVYNDKGTNPNTESWGLSWDSSSPVTEIENYGSIFEE